MVEVETKQEEKNYCLNSWINKIKVMKLSESYCTQGDGSLKRKDTGSDQSSEVTA